MPHRRRYRLPADSGGSGNFFLGLFILLVGAVAGVVWWRTNSLPPASKPSSPAALRKSVRSVGPNVLLARANSATQAVSQVVVNSNVAALPRPASAPNPRPVSEVQSNAAAGAINSRPNEFPRAPQNILEAQIVLARRGFSSGSIDGVNGAQTQAALRAWQQTRRLAGTGELDAATRATLLLELPPLGNYVITSNELARLQPLKATWLGKSLQTALDYETILELVAERGQASPNLLRRLNPGVNWTNVAPGTEIRLPEVNYPVARTKAAFVHISLREKRLQAYDAETNLLVHFPCSIAARLEKRPAGELRVVAVAPNPDYTFNPEVFPESAEAQQLKTKLILPPGPNNPVGTAWISLDKPGYGIHGTPSPEQVGRTESHGCFRLANWNAEYLLQLVTIGLPVYVEP